MPTFNQPIPGATTVIAELELRNNPDLPVVDASRVRGGGFAVDTVALRNGMPAALRKAGVSRCYVKETDTTYLLKGGILNDNWVPELATPSLEVGAFLGLVRGQVGSPFSLSLPANLFVSRGGIRSWSIDSVQGVPGGLAVDKTKGLISGMPLLAGIYCVVINGVDSEGNMCQYVLPLAVDAATVVTPVEPTTPTNPTTPTTPAAPTTVGAAALNIVAAAGAECSVVLKTAGLTETGARCYAVGDNGRRFTGGTGVTSSLAFGSAGYSSVPDGIGYYSFGFNLALFRSRYPSVATVSFEVLVKPSPTPVLYYINRVNYSYLLSDGFVEQSLINGFDYNYKNPGAQTKAFWHFNKGQTGAQNQDADLHDQFTCAGGEEKKIGTMQLNMSTGVCVFTPVDATPTPTPSNPVYTPPASSTPTEDDYIESVLRREVGTDVLYFIRMAYNRTNDTMRPVVRSRNAAETAWRGNGWFAIFPELSGTTLYPTEYAQGYHYVWRGNLSLNNEADFSMVIQFNDQAGAPAWSIVEDAYQATTQPATVEIYNAQTWRVDKQDGTDGYSDGTPAPTYTDEVLPKAVSGLWFEGEYTLTDKGYIEIHGNPEPDGLGVQLKISRQDGQGFALANDQNPVLQSDKFYLPGPLSGHGNFIEQWAFGKSDGTGGLTVGMGYVVTIVNDNGAQQSVSFVPKVGINQPLFGGTLSTGTGTPTGGTGTTAAQAEKNTINYTSTSNDDGGTVGSQS